MLSLLKRYAYVFHHLTLGSIVNQQPVPFFAFLSMESLELIYNPYLKHLSSLYFFMACSLYNKIRKIHGAM